MASAFTVLELLSHLADPSDDAFAVCERAVGSLWEHCRWNDEPNANIPFAADSEAQMALTLFGSALPQRHESAGTMSEVVRLIATRGMAASAPSIAHVLSELRVHRDSVESVFASDMADVVQTLDPGAPGSQPWPQDADRRKRLLAQLRQGDGLLELARVVALKAAAQAGVVPSHDDIEKRSHFLLSHCAAPLHFYQGIIRKIVESGIDFAKSKHVNGIWDMQLCFYASPKARLAALNLPLVLVSNERGIKAAAEAGGAHGQVFSLEEYRALLSQCGTPAP
jgi:hypothetical protein